MPKQLTRKMVIFDENGNLMDEKAARAAAQRHINKIVQRAFLRGDPEASIQFDEVVGNDIDLTELMTEAYGAPE